MTITEGKTLSSIQTVQGSLSRMITKLHWQNAQSATKKHLVDYVKRWITLPAAGVSLVYAPLKLNIKINPYKLIVSGVGSITEGKTLSSIQTD